MTRSPATLLPLLLALLSGPAAAQGDAARDRHGAAFDQVDRASRQLIATVRCAQAVATARNGGAFGPADSLGPSADCLLGGPVPLAVSFEADTGLTALRRSSAITLRDRRRHTGPFDAALVLARARARRDAIQRGGASFATAERHFAPFTIQADGDSVEVWLVPVTVLGMGGQQAVGGERGFRYSPDGRTLVREFDASARFRPFQVPDTGQVTINSQEAEVPLLSELLLANLLHEGGRPVTIVTRRWTSVLRGTGEFSAWIQVPRN